MFLEGVVNGHIYSSTENLSSFSKFSHVFSKAEVGIYDYTICKRLGRRMTGR